VFAGMLKSRTRQMAWEDIVSGGGIPERTVTERTSILVAGDVNREARRGSTRAETCRPYVASVEPQWSTSNAG
jgi:hypothetical protein